VPGSLDRNRGKKITSFAPQKVASHSPSFWSNKPGIEPNSIGNNKIEEKYFHEATLSFFVKN
jgi:hypothetical protein